MSALDVLRQIKQLRRSQQANAKIVEWGNADFINTVGIENLTRRELRNHLEARDLETAGTRLELLERLRTSLADEQLHKFAYVETLDTEQLIQADLEERGSVYVAGINNKGQLGLGDMDSRNFFTCVPTLRGVGVFFVASGPDMSFAVTQDNDVYVWGGGGVGKTGINPHTKKRGAAAKPRNWLEPVLIPEMAGEECNAVALGSSHCLAMGRGGDVFVWGDNESGQLGLGHFEPQITVAINNSFPPAAAVQCGAKHSMVLTVSGEVYAWGHAANGRLGLGETERLGAEDRLKNYFHVPQQLRTLEEVQEISCGADHTLARGPSGVWAWGSGAGGKLGLADHDYSDRTEPNLVPRLRGRVAIAIAAGTWHSFAILAYPPILRGGYLYSWGSGYCGQLAQGSVSVLDQPKIVEFFVHCHTMLKSIAAGPSHCLGVTVEGELYSWGSNAYGQLARKIEEKDVNYTSMPGHVPGFGALVGRVGRGFPRSMACGTDYSVVATYPYEGPDYIVATKLMEEAKIREQEAMLSRNANSNNNQNQDYSGGMSGGGGRSSIQLA